MYNNNESTISTVPLDISVLLVILFLYRSLNLLAYFSLYIPIQNKIHNYLVTVISTVAWLLIKTDIICNIYIIILTNIAMCIYLYVGTRHI